MYLNTVSGVAVQTRLTADELTSLENWRRAQEIIPTRSDALRQLMKQGLALRAAQQQSGEAAPLSDQAAA